VPAGRYVVMDGDGVAVGSEEFRCAPGPAGWRWYSEIETGDPEPHREVVDLAVDATWRPVRLRIDTGGHRLELTAAPDALRGSRDGVPLDVSWDPERHLDYLSPVFNAVTAMRLGSTTEIDVCYVEAITLEPRNERQRYELLGDGEVATPVGRFDARRWRYTSLSSGWTRELWIAGDVVVRYDGLFELERYDPGASGPRPSPD